MCKEVYQKKFIDFNLKHYVSVNNIQFKFFQRTFLNHLKNRFFGVEFNGKVINSYYLTC